MLNEFITMNINGYETTIIPKTRTKEAGTAAVYKKHIINGVDLHVRCDFRYENEQEFDAKFMLAAAAIENTGKVETRKLQKEIVSVEKF